MSWKYDNEYLYYERFVDGGMTRDEVIEYIHDKHVDAIDIERSGISPLYGRGDITALDGAPNCGLPLLSNGGVCIEMMMAALEKIYIVYDPSEVGIQMTISRTTSLIKFIELILKTEYVVMLPYNLWSYEKGFRVVGLADEEILHWDMSQ